MTKPKSGLFCTGASTLCQATGVTIRVKLIPGRVASGSGGSGGVRSRSGPSTSCNTTTLKGSSTLILLQVSLPSCLIQMSGQICSRLLAQSEPSSNVHICTHIHMHAGF